MKRNLIRQIYLYAVSIISLFIVVFSASQMVNIGLKTWVFTQADKPYNSCDDSNYYPYAAPAKPVAAPDGTATPQMTDAERAVQKVRCEQAAQDQQSAQKQRDLVSALSMLIVGIPVFWFHFRIVQREREEDKENKDTEQKKA